MNYKIPISHHLHSSYNHPVLRKWQCSNTQIESSNLVYPIFVLDEDGKKNPIKSLQDQYQWSVDRLNELIDPLKKLGLKSVIVFGVINDREKFDNNATWADHVDSPVVRAIKFLKKNYPDLHVIADVCLCQYTSHGNCGILDENENIDNLKSVIRIAQVATNYAKSGCDMVAPSDMMDGRIGAIKASLESENLLRKVSVMSYSTKFSSSLYGPFREAVNSRFGKGNRESHQLPYGSSKLAIRAALRDIEEGADFLMIKPGGLYLDIIRQTKEISSVPIAVYQVSGEYASLSLGANQGLYDFKAIVMESIVAFRRAGADVIITYFTPKILEWISACGNEL